MHDEITKAYVLDLYGRAFGDPAKVLKKIIGWNVRGKRELVVQLDSQRGPDQVYVWVAANEHGVTPIDCPSDLYPAGKSRHHDVISFSSLAQDKWAIRFRPRTRADLINIVGAMIPLKTDRLGRAARRS